MATTTNLSTRTRAAAGSLLGLTPHSDAASVRSALATRLDLPDVQDVDPLIEHRETRLDPLENRLVVAARLLLCAPTEKGHTGLVCAFVRADSKVPDRDRFYPTDVPVNTHSNGQMFLAVS